MIIKVGDQSIGEIFSNDRVGIYKEYRSEDCETIDMSKCNFSIIELIKALLDIEPDIHFSVWYVRSETLRILTYHDLEIFNIDLSYLDELIKNMDEYHISFDRCIDILNLALKISSYISDESKLKIQLLGR